FHNLSGYNLPMRA
ncbi:D-3-phosphoglycerate dehydrogenase domain protein, partial [Vibrio parahaemolyticus AQ3810]